MSTTASAPSTHDSERPFQIAVSVETIAYVVILLIAVGFRWIKLGSPLLADFEAEQAFAALSLLDPVLSDLGVIQSPIVFLGSLLSLALGSPTSATARFFSMLTGVFLVFSPLLLKTWLGRAPTLFAMAALAVSPTAIAACRQVSGVSVTMLGTMILLYAIIRFTQSESRGWAVVAGVASAVVLLSDFAALANLIALGVGLAFALYTDDTGDRDQRSVGDVWQQFPLAYFLIPLLIATALIGSVFFLAPNGLQAVSDLFTRFLRGLVRFNPDVTNPGLTFVTYEPMLFILGTVALFMIVRADTFRHRFLAGWGIASLIVLIGYRGAWPEHALFAILPFALLAGIACEGIFRLERQGPGWVGWAHMLGIVAVFGILLLFLMFHLRTPNVMTIPFDAAPEDAFISYSAFLFVDLIVLLLLVMTLFFSAGWFSVQTALFSLGGATLIVTMLASIGMSGNLTFTDTTDPAELVRPFPSQPGLNILVDTVEDISKASAGNSMDVPITVESNPDSALAWALYSFRNVEYVNQVDPSVSTPIVITSTQTDPALGEAYLGQEFVVTRTWIPSRLELADFLRWWIYRYAPTPSDEQIVILWVEESTYQLSEATSGR